MKQNSKASKGGKQSRSGLNPAQDSKELFLKKLQICSQILDFNDENKNVDLK